MSYAEVIKKINIYVKSNYTKENINNFIMGDIPYNHRCHLNGVQKVKEEKALDVFLCYIIKNDDSLGCVHFVNRLENGKYQDNTLGWTYEYYSYYIIKKVEKNEYDNISDLLINTKKMLFELNSNWFERVVLRLTHNII